jgi:hypothetical protein
MFKNYRLGWPVSTDAAFELSSVFNLEFNVYAVQCSFPGSTQASGQTMYRRLWLAVMASPLVTALALAGVGLLAVVGFAVVADSATSRGTKIAFVRNSLVRAYLTFLMVMYLPLTLKALMLRQCERVRLHSVSKTP